MKEFSLDSLTTNDRESYAKYLASLINEYQLRTKYAGGQEQETIASERHAKMRNVKERVKRKIDKILLVNLRSVDYSYNLVAICFLLFFSMIGIQYVEGKEEVANGDIKQFEYQDTLKPKIQQGNNPELAIANMLQQKKEYGINHDFNKAIVAHGNGVESEALLFQSLLTRYQKGYKSQTMRPGQAFVDGKLSVNNGNVYRLGCYNANLRTLYGEAFLNDQQIFSNNRIF